MSGRILIVPYRSQNDADATAKRSDCGPACVAMLLGAIGKTVATNAVTAASDLTTEGTVQISQLIAAAKSFGLELSMRTGATLVDLKVLLDQGSPSVALIKYGKLPERWDRTYVGGHFVVVVGYDDDLGRIYLNDPDYPPGALGYQRAYAYRDFTNAWGGFDQRDRNSNFCLLVPKLSAPIPSATPVRGNSPQPGVDAWLSVPGGLTLWSRPNASGGVISQLVFGQHLSVLDTQPAWRQVSTDSSLVGWISNRVGEQPSVSMSQPAIPFPVEVNNVKPVNEVGGLGLRSEKSINTGSLDQAKFGERLTVYDSVTGEDGVAWLSVQSARLKFGWVRDRAGDVGLVHKVNQEKGLAVDALSTESGGTPPTPSATSTVWVIAPLGLVLRAEPHAAAQRLGSIPFGWRLIAIGEEFAQGEADRTWLEVRTDNGKNGFVQMRYRNERYLSSKQPPAPWTVKVLDSLPARAGGLIVFESRSTSAVQLAKVRSNDQLVVYGRVFEDAVPWLWVRTSGSRYGWLRERQDDVTLVEQISTASSPTAALPTVVWPFGKCLAGVGAANPQPLTALEFATLRESRVEAFKMLTLPDPIDTQRMVENLKQIPTLKLIVARLFFPVDLQNKTPFSPQTFVNTVLTGAQAAYQAGVRYFEVHNEPNLIQEGLEWNWRGGQEFGAWLTQVLALLRQRFPEIKLGFPGLSPQPNVRGFLDDAAGAIKECDWIGCHCYWQSAEVGTFPMTATNAGMYWRQFRDRYPDKLLMITEFSNNLASVDPQEKGRQYARYFQLLREEKSIGAAFAFAVSWPGQDQNREGWIHNDQVTGIAASVGVLLGQPGFLA